MKRIAKLLFTVLMLVCIQVSFVYADEDDKEKKEQERISSHIVSATHHVTLDSTDIEVYYDGYINVDNSGQIVSWDISISTSYGYVSWQHFVNNGLNQVLAECRVTYHNHTTYDYGLFN